jgi:hypothetical protein
MPSRVSSVSLKAELCADDADMTVAGIEELPVGLDWQAFQSRCLPGGRRHDFKAVAAYFAYKQRPPETTERDDVTANAVEAWEDEGGSTPQAGHRPPRHEGGKGRAFASSRRSPIRRVRLKTGPDRLST